MLLILCDKSYQTFTHFTFSKSSHFGKPSFTESKKTLSKSAFYSRRGFPSSRNSKLFSVPSPKQKPQRAKISKHFALTLFIRAASSRNLFLSLVPLPERREPKTFLLARFRVAQAANHDVPVGRPRAPLFQPFGALHNASLKLLFVLLSLSDGIPTEHASRLFEELFPFFLFATLSS